MSVADWVFNTFKGLPGATAHANHWADLFLGRSLGNKSSKDVAFPHPQSRKDHYRKEDKPSCGGIVRKLFKRTIDITEYRNAEDEVNPAKNRTLGALVHDWCNPPRFMSFEPPETAAEKLHSR